MGIETEPTDGGRRLIDPVGPDLERSPCDLMRLVVAAAALLVAIAVAALFGDTLVAFAGDLFAGLSAIPRWLLQGAVGVVRVAAVAVLALAFVGALTHGRWTFLARVAAGAALAVGLLALVLVLDLAPVGVAVTEGLVAPGFPTAYGLAAVTGALTAAAPWLGRRQRQVSWLLVLGLAVARFVAVPMSFDTGFAVLAGWCAGAAALLALQGPRRRPTARAIAEGLDEIGIVLDELVPASVDARGSTPYLGRAAGGQRLFVKALGEDERSADLLFRLWRRVLHRRFGDEPSFSTLRRAVEHEALVALTARDLGIPTPRFLALARAEPSGFVLAYEAVDGRSLDRVDPDEMTDELLAAVWEQLAHLRRRGIAHRDLRLANLFRASEGHVLLIDFGFSELAASRLLLDTDVAELLASTASVVGPERAVAAARAGVGDEALRSAVPRLDLRYLSGATRTALHDRKDTLAELRRLARR